jgi:hypothetical protein
MKIIKKIEGKKTYSTAVVYLILQLLKLFQIPILNNNEELIENGLIVLFSTGILDKAIRSETFKKIWRKVKTLVSGVISREKNGGDADH